ncbi:MAG: PTS sugar transporter subunit IIA [Enterococcus sp.]
MLGIVIATHGTLAEGLKDAAAVIIGRTSNVVTVSLKQTDDIQLFGKKIKKKIAEVNQESGVIILTDIVSASPYNQSVATISQLDRKHQEMIYVIGGVNLPMVLETMNHQLLETSAEQAVPAILSCGSDGVQSWHVTMIDEKNEEDDF